MTVPSQESSIRYATDGVTTDFTVPFYFIANDHLVVTLGDDTSSDTLALGSDYSVSGAGQQAGGTVTLAQPPGTGLSLFIERQPPFTQETAYQRNDAFPERAHERALDKLTMLAQQLRLVFSRALRFPVEYPIRDPLLPRASLRARKAVIFDDEGNVTVGKDDYDDQAANAAASAAAAAQSASSANEDRLAVEEIATSFGDLDAARNQWESAVTTSEAAASRANADAARAETAADAANLAAGVYPSTGVMIAGDANFPPVQIWHYASVPSQYGHGFLDLYQRTDSGVQYVDTYPNKAAVDAAVEIAQRAHRPLPARPRLARTYSDEGHVAAWTQSDGVVMSAIDSRGRSRGIHVPDDAHILALRSAGQTDKQIVIKTADSSGAVLGGWDGLGRYRAAMVPDDALKIVLLRSFSDPGGFYMADATATIFAQYPGGDTDGGGGSLTGLFADVDADTKRTAFIWPHGATQMLRLIMRPNGFNDLYNVRSIHIAPLGDPAVAVWQELTDTSTDWIPPLAFRALNDGDGASAIFTGGNHGSNGSDGGVQTARMVSWSVTIDGRPLSSMEKFSGYVSKVSISFVNELMAYNTITLNRYALRQSVVLHILPYEIVDVYSKIEALEDIQIQTDYALQMSATGFNHTCHYLGGQQQARTTYAAALNTNSGPSDTWDAWAISLGHSTNGFQTSWMDRNYGAGDGSLLAASAPFCRVNAKAYHGIIQAASMPVIAAGNSYEWHGGYCWSPADIVNGLDCAFLHQRGNKPQIGYAFTTAGQGVIRMPAEFVGSMAGSNPIGAGGLAVSASGYETQHQPIQ